MWFPYANCANQELLQPSLVNLGRFVRPVCVIDCSVQSAEDEDFLLTTEFIKAWEDRHGQIPGGSWVLMRTDWSKRSGAEYLNMREDGAHTPGQKAA